MNLRDAIAHSASFGHALEDLVVSRGSVQLGEHADREQLLLAYWSLVLDYDKGVLCLAANQFYGSAFALVRPILEAIVRVHVVLSGTEDDVRRIGEDTYQTSFKTIGTKIDAAFGLEGLFDRLLNDEARGALHSFTHSGLSQLRRRFVGDDLHATYTEGEVLEVVRICSSAAFMATNLVTRYFGFEAEWAEAGRLYSAWGKVFDPPATPDNEPET